MTRCVVVAVAGFMAALAPQTAMAQDCAGEIVLLAQQYGLAARLPKAAPQRQSGSLGVSPEDLARSGGVIEPPEQGRGRIVRPPEGIDPEMSVPEVAPQQPQGGAGARLSPAKRAQMQSLVDSARNALERGDETECLERIARARAIPEPG